MNREEYISIRRLFGAFSTYVQYYEQMKKRAQMGPRWLWRDLRMLAVVWQRVLHGLCQTMPEDKLKTLHSELDHIQIEVYVKNPVTGGKRHDGNLYVPEDAMCRLIDKAMSMECFGCTKCGADVKKCPLRKDINALYPYEIPRRKDGYCEMADLELPPVKGDTNE